MADRLVPPLVAVGGFLGATSRYAIGAVAVGPDGTLLANVVGSFLLAATIGLVRSTRLRIFLATGLFSSFTTYSTFAVETVSLGPSLGLINIGATYALGVAAAFAGLVAGRRFT